MKQVKIGAINTKEDLLLANQLAAVLLKKAWDTVLIPLDPPDSRNNKSSCRWIENQLVFNRIDLLLGKEDICQNHITERIEIITVESKKSINLEPVFENPPTNVSFVFTYLKSKSSLLDKIFADSIDFERQ